MPSREAVQEENRLKPADIVKQAYKWGPVLFGVGFLAPLIAQSLEAAGITAPAGLATAHVGLVAGLLAGMTAKLRGGRWI
jgi:hypothetical protein